MKTENKMATIAMIEWMGGFVLMRLEFWFEEMKMLLKMVVVVMHNGRVLMTLNYVF